MLAEWLERAFRLIEKAGRAVNVPGKDMEREKIYREVEEARREWLQSRAYFNLVTEPELVDHAIYAVEAAEKKYIYLLKRVKEKYPELDGKFKYN